MQARHEAVEEARLGEREAEPLDAGDLVAHLGLAGDRLDDLAEDDADADAGAHGAEAAAHAEGDRLARVRAVVGGGEDEGEERLRALRGLLWLVGLGDRAAEVDGSERGEDERLQRRDQADLEEEERDAERERERRRAPRCPSSTARPPDMNRMIRWPARMLAKRRTESEISRMKFESSSSTKIGTTAMPPVHARGDQALEVADEALGADALDVVGDEHDEREHERDREVRRRRVERERRDLDAEDVDRLARVLVGSGM